MPKQKPSAFGRVTLVIDAQGTPFTRAVLREVLDHAGLFVHEIAPAALPPALEESVPQVVVLAGALSAEAAGALQGPLSSFIERGGGVIGLGGPGAPQGQSGEGVLDGLFELFGLRPALNESFAQPGSGQSPWQTLGEGWLKILDRRHPLLAGFEDVPLHIYGGQAVVPLKKGAVRVLAGLTGLDGKARPLAALAERPAGRGHGTALFVAADLAGSAAHIRTGRPVHFDGVSAPDGTAPLADGLLKAEDGLVLDFLRDRRVLDTQGRVVSKLRAGAWPIFDQPIADALAQLLVRAIVYAAFKTDVRLPRLWYHPDGLSAVGHISHDSDGNDPALGELLHQVMSDLDVRSTWCLIHPGYAQAFHEKLKAFGHELALHYDAMGKPVQDAYRTWGREPFEFQSRWFYEAAGVRSQDGVLSNKNHFTRWEGGLEFLEWCARQGLQVDQTRGPSKRGTIGYPFGSCHPHFLCDGRGARVPVLEVAFQTQDLEVTAPGGWGPLLVERALRWHGVCHLLFHPAHIDKPGVAQSLRRAIDYGKKKGVPWRTCREIGAYEFARRACLEAGARWQEDGAMELHAPHELPGATLLVLGSTPFGVGASGAGVAAVSAKKPERREGFAWSTARLPGISGGVSVRPAVK